MALFEGDSIESFAGQDWEKNLVKEITKYKKKAGISESHGSYPGRCLSDAQILRPLANSPDFSEISIDSTFLGLISKKIGSTANVAYFSLDPSLVATFAHITKAQYEYFSSNAQGKKEIEEFKEYKKNCSKALPSPEDFYDVLGRGKKCIDALRKNYTYINQKLKPTINNYLAGKTSDFINSIDNYFNYNIIIMAFSDKIERLRQGHSRVLVLGFQDSRDEYPLDHAIAAKILSPNANKIIVINSENRHLEANKTLKMLHQIFNLPLPEELK